MDVKTGNGFQLDFEQQKVLTKYTYGVALLQLPVYLLADVAALFLNFKTHGFSAVYHWSINVAAVFYLITGLYFTGLFLFQRYSGLIVYLTLLTLFGATNLYFYSIDETGMSHVYSFALFGAWLYLMQRTNYLSSASVLQMFLIGMISGLIFLIRPTAVMFFSAFLFLDLEKISVAFERIKRLLQLRNFLLIATGIVLVWLPQLFYWKYAYGSFFTYSYAGESFNWTNPQLLKTWFSPNNGLFLYTLFFVVILTGLLMMVREKNHNGFFLLLLFILISYIFASWWDWSFGCSFGARSFVEYLALFSIPVAHVFQKVFQFGTITRYLFGLLIVCCIAFNLKMTYTFDECFYGERDWDWKAYFQLVKSRTK